MTTTAQPIVSQTPPQVQEFDPITEPRPRALLLSEAALYLLARVIQKVI
jgi:hypothetical protein